MIGKTILVTSIKGESDKINLLRRKWLLDYFGESFTIISDDKDDKSYIIELDNSIYEKIYYKLIANSLIDNSCYIKDLVEKYNVLRNRSNPEYQQQLKQNVI